MKEKNLVTDDAMALLVDLIRHLFSDKIPRMKEEPIRRRFEKDLFRALNVLADEPSGNIDKLSVGVQRLVYEMITQYVMLYSLQPDKNLSIELEAGMTDNDKIAVIIRQEMIPKSWPYPQSVPL